REPAVAILDDAAQRVIRLAAQEDRRMRALRRLGPGPDRIEPDHLAAIGGGLLGPDLLHRENAFAHQLEPRLVLGAVVFHLLDVPAAADAKDEPPARQPVEAGDAFRGDDRVALGNEADAGAEHQLLGRRCREAQRDERVVRVRIALGQLAAAAERRLAAGRDVGVLGDVERVEAAIFERARQLGDVDAVIGREIEGANPHSFTSNGAASLADNQPAAVEIAAVSASSTAATAPIAAAAGSIASGAGGGGGAVCSMTAPEAKQMPFSAKTWYMRLRYSRCTQLGLTGRAVNLKRSTTALSTTSAMPCSFSGSITSAAISASSCIAMPICFAALRTVSISVPGSKRRLNLIVAKSRLRLVTAPSCP